MTILKILVLEIQNIGCRNHHIVDLVHIFCYIKLVNIGIEKFILLAHLMGNAFKYLQLNAIIAYYSKYITFIAI